MKIAGMNWMQVEDYLRRDDRAVIPLGSVEQHAYLSLATDAILSERVAVEAAEPLGVLVFPALAYGITPHFRAFPGTVSLRVATYLGVIRDMLDSLVGQGFRRFVLVNGHGGNLPAGPTANDWMAGHPGTRVALHNWWSAPETLKATRAIDAIGSHAAWNENFPWNRVAPAPDEVKSPVDPHRLQDLSPEEVRKLLGDGNYGGVYKKPDEQMVRLWRAGVDETRRVIEGI
jgi:creatinine amidohydrolase